ncbi:MAG: CsbD family protein [Acetobacter sp.]|uniref:CsbD family protein n=1 Tax=Acetobacter sicerae TaxID=85325 RepID=A0ABS8VSN0_9PROT|nr:MULTISPECIES: CsbD family protein [Acetobacter]MCE0743114.1 CsbD family protein [Acetobacter sicerae]NHN90965.1 CsbD family protein [Acetobacter sicerae]
MSDDKINTTEEKIHGVVDQAKGHIKDAAGGLTGDMGLQADGKVDQLAGIAREEFADLYEEGESLVEKGVSFVRDKPLCALGIAAAVGTFIGWLLMPRRKG